MTSYTSKSAYPYPDPTDQVSDYPTTAQSLANYLDNLPNRNRIINGQMDIWQRGTSFSNPATGAYIADRWIFQHNGTGGTRTISQSTIAAGTTIGGMQPRNVLSFAVTNAGSPAASSQTIGQRIEDVRTFAGESVTISAWVANNSTALNTLTIKAVQNFGTGGSPSAAVTTTVATKAVTSSYVRISATVTIPSISGKTLGTTDNNYLEIQFDIGAQTGTLLLWGVQAEQGTTTTALERVVAGEELRRCQRYYYLHADGNNKEIGAAWYYSATQASTIVYLPVTMRAAPVLANVTGGNYFAFYRNGTFDNLDSWTLDVASTTTVSMYNSTDVAGTAGQAGIVRTSNASARVAFSSEL